MYLSERKRAQVRKCMENCRLDPTKNKQEQPKGVHDTPEVRKVSQILFDARDGREVFTPF